MFVSHLNCFICRCKSTEIYKKTGLKNLAAYRFAIKILFEMMCTDNLFPSALSEKAHNESDLLDKLLCFVLCNSL